MRSEKTLIKLKIKRGRSQQTLRKSRELVGANLKTYIQMNWKIQKNCTNF
jgi:hypothetical protein